MDNIKKTYMSQFNFKVDLKPKQFPKASKPAYLTNRQGSNEKKIFKTPQINYQRNSPPNMKKNINVLRSDNLKTISPPTKQIIFTNRSISKNTREKERSIQKKSTPKQMNMENTLRFTSSLTNMASKTMEFPMFELQNNILKKNSSVRRTFQPTFRYKQETEPPAQYSKISSTLNYLENRINSAKKQIEKKKEKRFKFQEQTTEKIIIPQKIILKQQQSEISNSQSVNTVKKGSTINIASVISRVSKPQGIKGLDFNPYISKKNPIYYVAQIMRAANQKNSIPYEHIKTSIRFLSELQDEQIPVYSQIQQRKVNLKKKQYYNNKKTLVFDLDETLIHCIENDESDCDIKLTVPFPNGELVDLKINIRPHAMTILNQLKNNFELIIFTASLSCYADAVLDYIDPQKKIFKHRLYRQHCYQTQNGIYVKDLRIINRSLSDMVLIDNAAYSYAFQLQNGIPILPYYQGKNDYQLPALKSYLQKLINVKDVRQLNKKTFKLHHYSRYSNPSHLIQELYVSSS